MAVAAAAFQARGRRADLCRAPRRLGGHGPPRLRRGGIQRAPHLALRPDELAEFVGRGGRSAHPAPQAPRVRKSITAPRSAPARRGAGDARLHVERAHRFRIRPRHSARAQRLQRPARRLAGPLRRGLEIIRRAWTEEVFSYEGRFWSYRDVAIWPRPVQTPHPPVWVPVTGSKETIEWAGRHDIPITPGLAPIRGLREDIIRYYERCLARHGHRLTPDHR